VYLQGAVEILRKRRELDFEDIFRGKVSVRDLLLGGGVKKETIVREGTKLPVFLEDKDEYLKALDVIARCNFIE